MAQNSAHVTQTLQSKPSIFELVAADSLQSTFYPALKRVADYLANVNPEKYGWIVRYNDEVFLFLNAIIQQHYIRSYGGSLAEVFYSLCRVRSKTDRLSRSNKCATFLLIVIWPYIKSKIDKNLAKWTEDIENGTDDWNTTRQKQTYIKLSKITKSIYDCIQVIQYIRYLADRTKSHCILNAAFGQHLVYMTADANLDWSWSDLFSLNFRKSAVLTGIVFRGLELSAFFLQFVQWWHNETNHGSLTKLPNPEVPQVCGDAIGRYANICPICLQMWRIPTVNRISGYVFCYKCIVKHLSESTSCPVTNYASSIDDLIRIYDL